MTSVKAVPIGDVSDINPSFKSDGFLPNEVVDFLPMSAVEEGNTVVLAKEYRPLAEVQKGYTNFNDGDVLLAKITPCFENGKITQVRVKHCAGFGSTEFHVLRPNPEKLDGRYLVHFLRRQEVRIDGERKMTGSAGQRRVPKHFLEALQIPLLPLPEQRRIAAILDQADTLRAKRREALAQLESLTQSIFIEMFGDPVTNTKCWDSKSLDTICEVGSSKRVFVEELVEEGIPFYRGTEIGQLGDGQAVEASLFISKEHYERLKSEAGIPQKGDLLLPSICPDGRIYIIDNDEPFYFKDARVLWIKASKAQVNSAYLRQYLKQVFIGSYSKIASGTTFAELKIFALKNLNILAPPLDLQNRFAKISESINMQKEKYRSQRTEWDRLFASLQHHAFRGEL